MTMSDNEDRAEGVAVRVRGRKRMQAPASVPWSARDVAGKFLDTAPGPL